MSLLIAAFATCALVMLAMAVGVILGNIRIKGACGGLGAMKDDLGRPMCECGAREGQVCGRSADSDDPEDAGPTASYRPGADRRRADIGIA
jgi:hypothetical protein